MSLKGAMVQFWCKTRMTKAKVYSDKIFGFVPHVFMFKAWG